MPYDSKDPNIFDPSQMGWAAAGNAAGKALTEYAPLATLAGAGIGSVLAGKNRRLKGGIIGGLLGLGASTGLPALQAGMDASNWSSTMLDRLSRHTNRELEAKNPHWQDKSYLNDLYNTKPTEKGRNDMSAEAIAAYSKNSPNLAGWWPSPAWKMTDEAKRIQHETSTARTSMLSDALQSKGMPLSQYVDDPKVLTERAMEIVNRVHGGLSQKWPDQPLADAMLKRLGR